MATVPTFVTYSAGSVLTAAQLNSAVRDAGNFWLTVKPVCDVQANATQSIANGTPTAAVWGAETYDNDGMHSIVSNTSRVTAVTAGRYLFIANINYTANATGVRAMSIRNTLAASGTRGGGAVARPAQATVVDSLDSTWSDVMAVGDYVEVVTSQNSGGALNLVVNDLNGGTASMQAFWLANT